MKSPILKLRSVLSKLGGAFIVLAVFFVPVLTSVNAFHIHAEKNTRNDVVQLQKLSVRSVDNEPISPFDKPIISVTFDDGWESVYTDAIPVLQKDGIPTTQYIIAGEFDNPVYMSYAQVKSIKNAGHEIGSHTMTHPNLDSLSEDQVFYQLSESKSTLSSIQPDIKDFAAPYGASGDTAKAFIKRLYRSNRLSDGTKTFSVEKDINTKENFNVYSINAFAVTRETSAKTLQSYIDYTVAHNGWLILVYHQINNNSGDDYGVDKETFKQHMDLVSKSNIRVATVGSVLDALPGTKK